ncbi:MAG: hypothetical protein NC343_02035 [Muribaculum sp.]|nr:hypothetical protein [Muribaculaceae bacterium]MCM1080509.1 hypothetical protein [Muribaculum sp.]
MNQTLQIAVAAITACGGIELLKLLLLRRTHQRKASAEAATSEFHIIQETNQFLQQQLKEKEERFAEQTQVVRQLNSEIIKQLKDISALECQLATTRCLVRHCPNREPQNGY